MPKRPNHYIAARRIAEERLVQLAATTRLEDALPHELRRFAPLMLEVKSEEDSGNLETWLEDDQNRRRLAAPGLIIATFRYANILDNELRPIVSTRVANIDPRTYVILTFLEAMDEVGINFNPVVRTVWDDNDRRLFRPELIDAFERCDHCNNDAWLVRYVTCDEDDFDDEFGEDSYLTPYRSMILASMKSHVFAERVTEWYFANPTSSAAHSVYWSLRHIEFACGSGGISDGFLSPLDL